MTATQIFMEPVVAVRLVVKAMKCRRSTVTVESLGGFQHTGTIQTESESAGHLLSDAEYYCLSYAVYTSCELLGEHICIVLLILAPERRESAPNKQTNIA